MLPLRSLGKTGLRVTAIGLGGGGFSRLGIGQDHGAQNAEAVTRAALDAGVNLIDTAEAYGTESAIGNAIGVVARDSLILSTKLSYKVDGQIKTAGQIEASLDASLKRLRTDHVDIYYVHGATAQDYAAIVGTVAPALMRMRDKGKLRHIGITEAFSHDTSHRALQLAVQDDCWEVMMVGFNLLNTSARAHVFNATQAKGIGAVCMFAVRQALIDLARLDEYLRRKIAEGAVSEAAIQSVSLARALLEQGAAGSLTEAAYRYCLREPGIDCVLTGTRSTEHLLRNLAAAHRGPLPGEFIAGVEALFAGVATLSGQ
jgi:aryl-alcohol dehydrogenase-like predicted oxidoreductase